MTELESGRLLPTKILVREVEKVEEKVGSGLIYKPITIKDPSVRGEIVLTGTGTAQVEMTAKIGEQVIFSPHSFQKLRLEGEDFMLLDIRDCLFIIPPKAL